MGQSRYCAVIVDNLISNKELNEVIERHMDYLPGWACVSMSPQSIKSSMDYNYYLTSFHFWKAFYQFERVLIFQHDTGILRKGIDNFLDWHYVGAPWKENAPWARKDRSGGNGGLSLRCPKKALNLIKSFPYHGKYGNEDVYFTHNLEKVGGLVAPYEVCKKFSVETEYQLGTFGYHAISKHLTKVQTQTILSQYGDQSIKVR